MRFHRFQQEFTNTGQKYYFSLDRKKIRLHFITCLLVLLGSILGMALLFITAFTNPPREILIGLGLLIPVAVTILILATLFVCSALYFGYIIMRIFQTKKLTKFILTLEEGMVSFGEKPLTVSEKLTMQITFDDTVPLNPLTTTRLKFEPLSLSPFSQFNKIEKHLTYHEKRGFAEQLSQKLKIQLTDMFSSFEPGIHKNGQSFAEKLALAKFENSGSLIQKMSQNSHSVQLPLHKKKILPVLVLLPLIAIFSFFCLIFFFLWLVNGIMPDITEILSTLWPYILASFLYSFYIVIKQSKDKILVTDDSISLKRRYIWGTKRVFYSHFSELKDIAIISVKKSSCIVFRSENQTKLSAENSTELITEASQTINNLLVSKL